MIYINFADGIAMDGQTVVGRLFVGREDVYAVQLRSGAYTLRKEPLDENVIAMHLAGKITVGSYVIYGGTLAKFGIIDVDSTQPGTAFHYANAVAQKCVNLLGRNSVAIENSGRKGFHVWCIFEEDHAAKIRAFMVKMALSVPQPPLVQIEVFPKQERISEGEYGSQVKIPLGVHRVNGNRSFFYSAGSADIGTQLEYLQRLIPAKVPKVSPVSKKTDKEQRHVAIRDDPPCIKNMFRGVPAGSRNEAAIRLATHYLNRKKISAEACIILLKGWNETNDPPLSISELRSMFLSAKRRGYVYGCGRMLQFCVPNCPYKKRGSA